MRKQMLTNVSLKKKKIIIVIFTGFWTPLHPVSDPQIQRVALRRAEAS